MATTAAITITAQTSTTTTTTTTTTASSRVQPRKLCIETIVLTRENYTFQKKHSFRMELPQFLGKESIQQKTQFC